ncbi:MAG: hypothetical protein HY657_16425 [Acidobacteria bacterium]|nr:hypothetical protein [Acidobacteriota bacterium]
MRLSASTRLLFVLLALASATPAFGQVELAGTWAARNHEDALERGAGPYAVDYTGLPLSEEARSKALAYSANQLSMIERQCMLYTQLYLVLGPFGLTIWKETDQVNGETVALVIGAWEDRGPMTIWMDGRPHPSRNAPRTREGFTTGEWQGNTLVTRTTHMKTNYLRRNGAPASDEAEMTMHFLRHDNLLTLVASLEDPISLTEPYVLSKTFELSAAPGRPIGPPCQPGYEGVAPGRVPHFLPGRNPFIGELTDLYGIPRQAILGGAATMYPEFRKSIRDEFARPAQCRRNCGGGPPGGVAPPPAPPRNQP